MKRKQWVLILVAAGLVLVGASAAFTVRPVARDGSIPSDGERILVPVELG